MQYLSLIGTVAIIFFLGLISPGPDFVMTLQNSINHGRKYGIYTSIGLALGMVIHNLYCILGIALIISKSIIVFNTIKYLGALYLIYIGFMSILQKIFIL